MVVIWVYDKILILLQSKCHKEHAWLFYLATFMVLTMVTIKFIVFRGVMMRSLEDSYRHFEGTHWLHLQCIILDADSKFLLNVCNQLPDYMASLPR